MFTIYYKTGLGHGIYFYEVVKTTLDKFAKDYPTYIIIRTYAE